MIRWVRALVAVLLIDGAVAAERLREFSWSEMKSSGSLGSGQVIPVQGSNPECLLIENTGTAPLVAEILKVDPPAITSPLFALRGKIRSEGVEGTGYLEMWSHFPGGAAYFSRTLAEIGPMSGLRGTSGWRDVVLPFSAAGAPHHPTRLVANVVLPGKGRVWVGNLTLFQYGEGENPLVASGTWWSDRFGGVMGAVGGSTLGVVGGMIGTLCALGRWRSFVLGLMRTITVLGLTTLLLGSWAATHEQPYGVYYPLLLVGGLAALIFGSLLPVVRRRYAESELRRMAAIHAM